MAPDTEQSAALRHSTHRPTPLGGALHLGVVPVHCSTFLQNPGASGPQFMVVVLQNWSSGHSADEVQASPPARGMQVCCGPQ